MSNMDNFTKKFVCSKLETSSNLDILNQLECQFKYPEEYLKLDNCVIVGKKIDKEKFKNPEAIKSYQIIGGIDEIFPSVKQPMITIEHSYSPKKKMHSRLLNNLTEGNLSFNSFQIKKNYENFLQRLSNTKDKNNVNKQINNLEYVSDEKLEKIFYERKIKIAEPKKINNEIIKNIDSSCADEIKQYLNKQEKTLNLKFLTDKKNNNLLKFISRKAEKDEKDLLMNKTDGFRLKNECIQRINSCNPARPYQYGVFNNWKFNLRKNERPFTNQSNYNKNDYEIQTHLDIRSKNCDIYAIVKDEKKKEDMDKIIKPNSPSLKDFRKYANSRVISTKLRKMNMNCEDLLSVNNLNVSFYIFF